jgi:hypothetical protein
MEGNDDQVGELRILPGHIIAQDQADVGRHILKEMLTVLHPGIHECSAVDQAKWAPATWLADLVSAGWYTAPTSVGRGDLV